MHETDALWILILSTLQTKIEVNNSKQTYLFSLSISIQLYDSISTRIVDEHGLNYHMGQNLVQIRTEQNKQNQIK